MLLSYGADPNVRVYGEAGTNATLRPPLAELLISNDNLLVEVCNTIANINIITH